jgi:biopolymer transport protein ExbD
MIVPPLRVRRRARIEIIPLIDVIFFLLATFMMVSLSMIQNRGVPVRLPASATAASLERGAAATISLRAAGEIYFDGEPVDLPGLGARLDALKASAPDPQVFVGGDEGAPLGRLVAVLDEVRARGIAQVALETRPKRAAAEP